MSILTGKSMKLIENQEKNEIDIEEIKKSLPIPVNVSYSYNLLTVLSETPYFEFIIHLDENQKAKYVRYINPVKSVNDRKFLSLLSKIFKNDEWIQILAESEIGVLTVLYEEKQVPHKKYIELVKALKDVTQVYITDRQIQIFLWLPYDGSIKLEFCKNKEFYICSVDIALGNMSDKNKKVLSELLGMNLHEIKTKNVHIITNRPKRIPKVALETINRFQDDKNISEMELDLSLGELRIRNKYGKRGSFEIYHNYLMPLVKSDLDIFQKVKDLVSYNEFFEFLLKNDIYYQIPFEHALKNNVIPFLFDFLKAQKIKPNSITVFVDEKDIRLRLKTNQMSRNEGLEIIIPHTSKTVIDISSLLTLKAYPSLYIISPNNYIIYFEREKGVIKNEILDGIDTFLNGSLDKEVILDDYNGVTQFNDKKYCVSVDSTLDKVVVLPKNILPVFLRSLRYHLFSPLLG